MTAADGSGFRPTTTTTERYAFNTRGFGAHQAMIELTRPGALVLDVGCADGSLGAAIRAGRGAKVVGVEIDPLSAALAESKLDGVIIGDMNDRATSIAAGKHGPFDHIVFGDVLEHMVEPDRMLRTAVELLSPGGSLIVSLPNILSISPRWRMATGVWRYEDNGPFDRTHLRFFSIASARELLASVNLITTKEMFVGPLSHRLGRRGTRLTAAWPGLLANQIVVEATPAS